jgi:1,4-dihydroxy-2-naphthoate octaprenyltransferase
MNDTIKLLRFPFSVFLLPVSLFSFFYIQPEFNLQLLLVIGIWHLLVFPASNGYNSYNDRDEGSIGGLASPPKPTKRLLQVANLFDSAAILLSTFVNLSFTVFVVIYILASRLYSKREIRLKQYPIIGFLIVFIFQGAWVFCANIFALSTTALFSNTSVISSAIASSFFIATIYPITQIYQHEADRKDGVTTLSMILGKRGTFIFSGIMFSMATLFIYISFNSMNMLNKFWLFNMIMFPATVYFIIWAAKSFNNRSHINFKNTMIMLVLSSVLNNIYFTLILLN